MKPRATRVALTLLTLVVLMGALVVEVTPAFAATSDVGRNVGREIESWAKALMLGVAALVAIPLLAKRDVNGGLVLALLVIIVGGFVFAQDTVKTVIESLWHSMAG